MGGVGMVRWEGWRWEMGGVELWQKREQCTWDIANGELQFSQGWCGGGRGQGHKHSAHTH